MQAVAAIILAGGQSRRMGTDKARLRLPSSGPTLIERVATAVRTAGAHEVIVVIGGDEARLPAMDARFVRDAQPGAGPLAGLATGLAAMRRDTDVALVLACDLPYLSVPLLQWMIAQPNDDEWDALMPFLPDDSDNGKGCWQPLHALYRRACLTPIRAALEAGERRMTAFLPHIRVRTLTAEAMRLHDPALRSTHSVNTPDAWAEAARWLTARDAAILPPQEHGAGDAHDTKDAKGK